LLSAVGYAMLEVMPCYLRFPTVSPIANQPNTVCMAVLVIACGLA